MVAIKEKTITLKEYFKLDKASSKKYEYLNGKLHKIPGGTFIHNKIALRIGAQLLFALDNKEKEYHVFNSDMKIQIPEFNHFVYPDAVVVCETIKLYKNRKDIIVNPLLIVEVLSDSTKENDRGTEFLEYKTLPSFKEYVLVHQHFARVETFYRIKPKTWKEEVVKGLNSSIHLNTLDINISLANLYKGVKFG